MRVITAFIIVFYNLEDKSDVVSYYSKAGAMVQKLRIITLQAWLYIR